MSIISIGAQDKLFYEYSAPRSDSGSTYVFFNALTGDVGMWNNGVVKSLLVAGQGVLVYNMRGQNNSPFTPGTILDQSLIVDDATRLLDEVSPLNPIFVGLSIGEIYAAWTALAGADCSGLVLINTLRRDGPRLRWINDAVVRLAEIGGSDLLRDIMSPLIMNEDWLADNRNQCLNGDDYTPIDRDSGTYNLLASARTTNWDFPYEKLTMPTLVITGLHDRVFRDPDDIDTLCSRIPNARRLDIDSAGHMVPVEQSDLLTDALLGLVT